MTRIDINNMPRKGKRKGQHREKSGTIDAADSDSIGSSEEELQTDLPQTPKKGKRQMKRARGREESEEEFHDSEEEFHDSEESDEQGRQATRRGMLRKKAKVEVKKREALATFRMRDSANAVLWQGQEGDGNGNGKQRKKSSSKQDDLLQHDAEDASRHSQNVSLML